MGATSRLMVEITVHSHQLEKELHQASRSADAFGQSLRKALTVAGGIGISQAFSEAGQAVGGMVKAGLEFEAGMQAVNDIARDHPKQRRYRRHLTKNRG